MARAVTLSSGERVQSETAAQAALAGTSLGNTLDTYQGNGLLVAVLGNVSLDGTERTQIAAAIASGYGAEREQVVKRLHGHFALAVVDIAKNEALLAVDRMGVHNLVYQQRAGSLIFASNASAVRLHPAAQTEIDNQAIFNYLYFHTVPGPRTAFTEIERLQPGSYLRVAPNQCEVGVYWKPDFSAISNDGYQRLRGEFRDVLEESVRRAGNTEYCGTFLSGGTDSSTVTGYAQRLHREGVPSFSIGFAAEGYDETAFARTAANHFGAPHFEYYITPEDIVEAIPLIAASYEEPFGNSSAVPTYFCAKLAAEHGVTRLLAGDGGDELFGGNTIYATQFVFSLYDRMPEVIRDTVLKPIANAIPSGTRFTPARKVRRYVEQASIPMPLRMETYNVLATLGAKRILSEEFLASVDVDEPPRVLSEYYAQIPARHLVNRMVALDFQFTLADNDLQKVTRMCDRAGVEVAFPLLDDALVDFSTRLPHRYKLSGTRLRPFFKRALSDFLPRQTIKKSKHGFGLPFGLWLRSHRGLHDCVSESLHGLRARGVVRDEFIDQLTGDLLHQHADYYGNLIWVLVMLEQWYRHQVELSAQGRSQSRASS
jgi:asparagine synthase (glutamine-hydrolysing)